MTKDIHEERTFAKQCEISFDSLDAAIDAALILNEDKAKMHEAVDWLRNRGFRELHGPESFTGEVRAILRKLEYLPQDALAMISEPGDDERKYRVDYYVSILLGGVTIRLSSEEEFLWENDGVLVDMYGVPLESMIEQELNLRAEIPMNWVRLAEDNKRTFRLNRKYID